MDHCVKVQTLAAIAGVILAALALSRTERAPGDWEEVPALESVNIETESGNDGGEVYLWIGGTEYRMTSASARQIASGLVESAASAEMDELHTTKAGANLRLANVRRDDL